MIAYKEIRGRIKTGDVFLLADSSLAGLIIRLFTAESYNHIALTYWIADNLWVAEMRGAHGYQTMPASQWARLNRGFTWGVAPTEVHANEAELKDFVARYRALDPPYSYWALPVIWLGQVLGVRWGMRANVCSTFVQRAWARAGYRITDKVPDPGDFKAHVQNLTFCEVIK
jgi:hypothetical protein